MSHNTEYWINGFQAGYAEWALSQEDPWFDRGEQWNRERFDHHTAMHNLYNAHPSRYYFSPKGVITPIEMIADDSINEITPESDKTEVEEVKSRRSVVPPKPKLGSIGSFVASMSKSKGFARPNKYEVVFTLPEMLMGKYDTRQLTLHCNTFGWPGHDLQTQTMKKASEPGIEMVQSHAFAGTISATFYLDTEHSERFLFEQWQELAVNRYTHKANYYKDYIGQMEIYQLSSEKDRGIRTYGIKVHDVYPATISATEYTYELAETIQVLTVSFNYRQHYPINIHDRNKYPTI